MAGKKTVEAKKRYDDMNEYSPSEALELVKSLSSAGFDETVEAAFRLGIDPRKADQLVRGTVSLPNGTGKTIRVAVITSSDKQADAEAAGADLVGGEELVAELTAGRALDFDLMIASPDMMAKVGTLGRVLGPRGLMPNPKAGTVTQDIAKAVTEFKGGRIEYRNDKFGNVHVPIGKVSFDAEKLVENFEAISGEINRARPASAKGVYMRNVSVSSTMGPGIRVQALVPKKA
jgi:large subunit ribosomal protein L1